MKAERKYKTIKEPVTTYVEKRVEDGYNLPLTDDEAAFLYQLLGQMVTGIRKEKYQRCSGEIFDKLKYARIPRAERVLYETTQGGQSLKLLN